MTTAIAKIISFLKPRRTWLQYRLRTIFVLVVIVALPCGWLKWKVDQKRRERAAVAEIERLGGRVQYDWQERSAIEVLERKVGHDDWQGQCWMTVFSMGAAPESEPTGPKWLRWLLGEDFFSNVVYVCLPPSIVVFFHKCGPGTFGFSEFTTGPAANDDDLRLVGTITGLKYLELPYASIGNVGLAHLKGLTSLRCLDLSKTDITDDGFRELESLTGLKCLDLRRTKTTRAAIANLQKAMPKCRILR